MDGLVLAGLGNAALVALLAPGVMLATRQAKRPAVGHVAWLLLLVKLVTPPLWTVPAADPAVPPETSPPRAGTETAGSTPDSPPGRGPAIDPGAARAKVVAPPRPGVEPGPAPGGAPQPPPLEASTPSPPWWGLGIAALGIAWLAGASAVAASATREWLGVRRAIASSPTAPGDITNRVAELSGRLGLRRAPEVRMVAAAISPMLWGIASRPILLIPEGLWGRLDAQQRDAVVVHELAHLRRRDHWVRLVELAASALYWWFPVAWWARRALREAEEQCCDAWVVWALPDARRSYAASLLDTVDFLAEAPRRATLLASGLGDAAGLKERLTRIMEGRTGRSLSRAALGALLLVAAPLMAMDLAARVAPRDWDLERLALGDQLGQVYMPAWPLRGRFGLAAIPGYREPIQVPLSLPAAPYGLAIGRAGEIYVVGVAAVNADGAEKRVAVSRCRPDGRPDAAFGDGGVVVTDLVPDPAYIEPMHGYGPRVALQEDGKVVVGATVPGRGGWADFALRRFLADGSPDRGFGDRGRVQTNVGLAASGAYQEFSVDRLTGLAVQADGRIVASGTTSPDLREGDDMGVVRYLPDGRLDPDFGTGGMAVVDYGGLFPPARTELQSFWGENAQGLVLAPDGRIAVVGYTKLAYDPDPCRWAIAVLDARGRPAAGFGDRGLVAFNMTRLAGLEGGEGSFGLARAARFDPDGVLLVVGGAQFGARGWELAAIRLDAAGKLDPQFGEGGLARPRMPFVPLWTCLGLLPDGSILVGGEVPTTRAKIDLVGGETLVMEAGADFLVTRFTPAGRLDRAFGAGGWIRRDVAGGRGGVTDIAVGPDGRVVLAGYAAIKDRGTMLALVAHRDRVRPAPLLAVLGGGTVATAAGVVLGRRKDGRPPRGAGPN